MILCCGLPRETSFCPDCGKNLADNEPLLSLLTHVRKVIQGRNKVIDRRIQRTGLENRGVLVRQSGLSKWLAWEAGLMEVLGVEVKREESKSDEV